jgi:uncharacterized protein YuzE
LDYLTGQKILAEGIAAMRIKYDPDVDVLTIYLRDDAYAESDQAAPNLIVDFNSDGQPIAIEILNAKQVLGSETVNLEVPLSLTAGR